MKPLYYKEIKPINGSKRAVIEIKLHDDYKNGHVDFHVYRWFEKLVFGDWKQIYSPNLPAFREYSDIIEMDGNNSEGQPMYAVENGMYHLKEDLKKGADYLGISMDQAKNLCLSDKEYFKYQLFAMGIVSEWREKAKKAISHLETLCGQSFVDYDNPVVLKLTDEEIADWWTDLDLCDKCELANVPYPTTNYGRGDEYYEAEERCSRWWYSRTYEQKKEIHTNFEEYN